MLRNAILFLTTLLSLSAVLAQEKVTVSGLVSDTAGQGLVACVFIEDFFTGTYTDSNGRFSMKVPTGEHTLTITSFGFKTKKEVLTITKATILNFTLEEDAVDIEAVHVYGKSNSQKLREGSFTVNAIEINQEISSLNNINTSLAKTSGIKIREDGGVGADFDLSINGLSGNSVRYFIDGVPLSSVGNGVTLANIPVNIIERVEVYKGVVPAYLGSDALGGAINIITKKDKKNYIDASYGIGSFGTHKADLNGKYVFKKSNIFIQPTLGLNYSKNNYIMNNVEIWNSETGKFENANVRRFHDEYFSFFSQLKTGVTDKKWADMFSVSTSYFTSDNEMQTGSVQSAVYGNAVRERESHNFSLQYQKKRLFSKKLSVNITASRTWDYSVVTDTAYRKYRWDGSYIRSSRNEVTGRAASVRHIERPRLIGHANINYRINHNHSLNVNYLANNVINDRFDEVDSEFESSKDKFNKHVIGLSYSQKFWHGKLSNNYFAKNYLSYLQIEQQDLYWISGSDEVEQASSTHNYGYGFSSRFRFAEQFSLKTSFERSVRLPLAREYLGNGTTVYPNLTLQPESSYNFNTGIFGLFNAGDGHRFHFEAGFFYRQVEDYIHLVLSESEGLSQYDNVNSVTVKGVEGEVRYNYLNLLSIVANTSYLDERNKTQFKSNSKPDITYNNRMPNRPWFFGNLQIDIKKNNLFGQKDNLLKLSYSYQYVHWFYLTWAGFGTLSTKSTIPTQHLNNAQVTYSLHKEKYNISLECRNVFNELVYDNYLMQKPGRSFFCKLRVFIN